MPTTWEAWGGLATVGMFLLTFILALPRIVTLGRNWKVGSRFVSLLAAAPDLLVTAPPLLLTLGHLESAVYTGGAILAYQLGRFALRRAPPSRLEIGYIILAVLSFNFVLAGFLQHIADARFELLLSRTSQEAPISKMPNMRGVPGPN